MSTVFEGSLYVATNDEQQLDLYDEIIESGHPILLSPTEFPERAPFLISRGREIMGENAIRDYFTTTD